MAAYRCNSAGRWRDARNLAVVNFEGAATAQPDAGVFVCARAYRAGDNTVHNIVARAFPGYDPDSSITGTMKIGNGTGATVRNTFAAGSMDVSGFDDNTGVTFTAAGQDFTNNVTDRPVKEAIRLTLNGMIADEPENPGMPTTYSEGSVTCLIQLPYAIGPQGPDLPGQPPDSENVTSDTDSD